MRLLSRIPLPPPRPHLCCTRPAPPANRPPAPRVQDVPPEWVAIAEEAPEDVLEAAEAKDDPIARFVLARILSQTAAHSHLQWDTLVEGARCALRARSVRWSAAHAGWLAGWLRVEQERRSRGRDSQKGNSWPALSRFWLTVAGAGAAAAAAAVLLHPSRAAPYPPLPSHLLTRSLAPPTRPLAGPLPCPSSPRSAGATVQEGPDKYRFTGKQLRQLAHLMRRVGLMLWQQALLFPQHITKLGTLRLDDPNNLHVEEVRRGCCAAVFCILYSVFCAALPSFFCVCACA